MTRADKSRLQYVLVLLGLGSIALGVGWYFSFRPPALITMALVLLIPGRLPALFWREFFRGQQQMQVGNLERAADSFEAFLAKVRARPWLKKLMYFKWGIHTWDIEAMTLNNLGTIFVERGDPARAAGWFEAALAVDPCYGLPYTNLAVVRYAEGDEEEAARLLERAHALGNRHLTHEAAKGRAALLRSMAGQAE
jgi:tetratricopeptide (TPR) repeat protein